MHNARIRYAFIDGNNLQRSVDGFDWYFDYTRFRKFLRDNFSVSKAYVFIGYLPQHEQVYEALRRDGFTLVFKEVSRIGTKVKGNCDSELVLQAVADLCCTGEYNEAVLVSGDGDFVPLVQFLSDRNSLKTVLSPTRARSSYLLRKMANKVDLRFIEDYQRFLERRK